MLRKNLDLQVSNVFLDPESKLVLLDVTHASKLAFKLVAVHALYESRRAGF